MTEKARDLAESLLGSCDPEPEELLSLEDEELEIFAEIAARCETCGWWVEPDDGEYKNYEFTCTDCLEE